MLKNTRNNFIESLLSQTTNIRNLSVIAHVDHGKSTLTDSLVAAAGIIRMKNAGNTTFTDTRKDELERGITIKSTGITMPFMESEFNSTLIYNSSKQQINTDTPYLVNLIDSPGHVDFSSEVTAALRATDGALVVVDIVEGVCVQTETVLSQALLEGIKPILCINKLDRAFLELHLSSEEIYHKINFVIDSVNAVIDTYVGDQWPYGDPHLQAKNGDVVFAAAKMGWAFSVPQFASMLSARSKASTKSWNNKLWGDNFYNLTTNKWCKASVSSNGNQLERGFCKFILDPIQEVFNAFSASVDSNIVASLMASRSISLTKEERDTNTTSKAMLKCVMQKWLPAHRPLLEAIVNHLPSPLQAQQHRVKYLYTGPLNDATATAIKTCDPNGPLCVYISKLVPDPEAKDKARFLAFGRVFSGTIKPNMKIRILGSNYNPENPHTDIFTNKSVQRTIIMMARRSTTVEQVPAGNTVALVGIDQFLLKTGTLTTDASSYPLKQMKFSVSAVVQRAVAPKNPKDIVKFVDALKKITQTDPLVKVNIDDSTKQMVIAAAGELHLEIMVNDLKEMLNGIEIVVSDPIVPFCETVTAESSIACLAKSTNKLNRLWCSAEPVNEELVEALTSGKISNRDCKSATTILCDEYGWTKNEAKKLWYFGPEGSFNGGANLLVDSTQAVQYLQDVKGSVGNSFQWVCSEGVLAQEELRGVKFNILNAEIHSDSVHRGGGQLIPCARKCLYAAQYTAKPALLEPFYELDVQCPIYVVNSVRSLLSRRRAVVLDEIESPITCNVVTIKASIPVVESFGLISQLGSTTGGKAFPSMKFSHWQQVQGDVFDQDSKVFKIVQEIRTRKGLPTNIPPLSDYLDKL